MQFHFPEWVNKARTKKAQASARLRYMINRLAIEHNGKASTRALCESTGVCRHAVASQYINRGSFSQSLAERFEQHFGSNVISAKSLVDPMSIGAEGPAASKK